MVIDVVKKDIKNIHLAVYPPDGNIRIASPFKFDDEAIKMFAISKISWIRKNIKKIQNQKRLSPRTFVTGESHYFKGQRYILRIVDDDVNKVEIKNKKYIELHCKPNLTKEQRERIVQEWYRKELKAQIPQLIEKYENITGLSIAEWGVRKMSTKWGTCNIKAKRIWLNLELAKKSSEQLEYIILHEMIHLLERKHNDNFKEYLDKFMPNWKIFKQELNDYIK